MNDATIHISLSRLLWEDGVEDETLGRLLREEVAYGMTRLEERSGRTGSVRNIEILLIDPAPAPDFWCEAHLQHFDGTRHGGAAYCTDCEREGGPNG